MNIFSIVLQSYVIPRRRGKHNKLQNKLISPKEQVTKTVALTREFVGRLEKAPIYGTALLCFVWWNIDVKPVSFFFFFFLPCSSSVMLRPLSSCKYLLLVLANLELNSGYL